MIKKIPYLIVPIGAVVASHYAFLPQEVQVIDLTRLPLRDAIHDVRGDGSRVAYIFESADCRFCRQLHPELEKLPNTTIYTFVLPGHTDSAKIAAASVWCAPERHAAWREVMTGGALPAHGCATDPSNRNLALAKALELVGTPAIITSTGLVHTGFASAEQLEVLLAN